MSGGVKGVVLPPYGVSFVVRICGTAIAGLQRNMSCDSPQYLIQGGTTDCGLCLSCCKVKEEADRARRPHWLKKKRGVAHG